MELNRNHWLCIGLLLLFMGIQFNQVESFVFTPEVTQFLARRSGHPVAAVNAATRLIPQLGKPTLPAASFKSPDWLGWCMMSVGAVLFLRSLAMPKPAG